MSAKKKSNRIPTPQIVSDASGGDLAAVKGALESGADVNAVDRSGGTALHQAAVNRHVPIVKVLLAAGADAKIADSAGRTALHLAARYLQPEIAKLLLDAGADVDALDTEGNTPLLDAIFAAREDSTIVRVLLAAGADRDRKNKHGVSPQSLAQTSSNQSKKKWLAE